MNDYTATGLLTVCLILNCKCFWNLLVICVMHFLQEMKVSSGKDCRLTEAGETLKGKAVCCFQEHLIKRLIKVYGHNDLSIQTQYTSTIKLLMRSYASDQHPVFSIVSSFPLAFYQK